MKNNLINILSSNEKSVSQDFREQIKLDSFKKVIPKHKWPKNWSKVQYKSYPRFKKIKLSTQTLNKNISLLNTFYNRRSTRHFTGQSISEKELSQILYYSAGLRKFNTPDIGNRFYPSAGARYPNEVYPIVLKGNGIDQGIYHYYVRKHMLEEMWKYSDLSQRITKCIKQKEFKKSAIFLIVSSVFWRTQVKYGDRGYRHLMLDTGHLCQNIYLISAALGIGCCSIGGFIDTNINNLLDLDGKEESVQIVIALGKI